MKSAKDICEANIQLKIIELTEDMDFQMQALYRRNAAAHNRKSGATFIEAMNIIKSAQSNLSVFMSEQYKWAIVHSIFLPDSLLTTFKQQSKFYFEQLNKHSMPHLQHTAKLVGHTNLFEKYAPEITKSLEEQYSHVEADIDASSLEKKNKGIIGGAKTLFSWLPKIFGSS